MSDFNADVVIIGSGISGALIASELAQAGVKVLILEAGPAVVRPDAVQRAQAAPIIMPSAAYQSIEWAPTENGRAPYYIQDGPQQFGSNYERVVGGSTWHWLGTALRLVPNDFSLLTTYGQGRDWPITYNQLEPFYGAAEKEIGVAGPTDTAPLTSPRSEPYPMPPIPPSILDQQLTQVCQTLGITVVSTPAARNSVNSYGGRPQCCGNANCIPVCPIGAKYDASFTVTKATTAGAQLIYPAVVYQMDTDQNGNITQVHFKDPFQNKTASGKLFVLAAHAIEGPKILQMSTSERYPNGLANSSGQVGRNLMDHPTVLTYALAPDPIYPLRAPLSTSGIEQFRDSPARRSAGAFRIEIGNDAWTWPVGYPPQLTAYYQKQGITGPALQQTLNQQMARQFRMAALVEQLPNPNNRIVPDPDQKDAVGIPRPRITYSIDQYTQAGAAAATDVMRRIYQAYGASQVNVAQGFFGAGHIMGTTIMGTSRSSSVVNPDCQSWDHPNLFMAGSSVFPSVGSSNPTLTIAALALRMVPTIQRTLTQLPS